jgi:hypothetical protein
MSSDTSYSETPTRWLNSIACSASLSCFNANRKLNQHQWHVPNTSTLSQHFWHGVFRLTPIIGLVVKPAVTLTFLYLISWRSSNGLHARHQTGLWTSQPATLLPPHQLSWDSPHQALVHTQLTVPLPDGQHHFPPLAMPKPQEMIVAQRNGAKHRFQQ